jgi:mRNA interferase RelE/StbE
MSGHRAYRIEYLPTVIKTDIPALSTTAKKMIKKAVDERLMVDPIGFGKPLKYSLKGHRRLRVVDYRVIHRIDENHIVVIVAVKHRKDVYE